MKEKYERRRDGQAYQKKKEMNTKGKV